MRSLNLAPAVHDQERSAVNGKPLRTVHRTERDLRPPSQESFSGASATRGARAALSNRIAAPGPASSLLPPRYRRRAATETTLPGNLAADERRGTQIGKTLVLSAFICVHRRLILQIPHRARIPVLVPPAPTNSAGICRCREPCSCRRAPGSNGGCHIALPARQIVSAKRTEAPAPGELRPPFAKAPKTPPPLFPVTAFLLTPIPF